jgi:hypothetical protein
MTQASQFIDCNILVRNHHNTNQTDVYREEDAIRDIWKDMVIDQIQG